MSAVADVSGELATAARKFFGSFFQKRTFYLLALVAASPLSAAELTLQAADGVRIFATETQAQTARPRGTIPLFHQAGSSRHEYDAIASRLAAEGFDTIAIDQRVGGDLFGEDNQTAAALGHEVGYTAALPDLEAALAYAKLKHPGGKILVWGSSYSASLVFLLAAGHPSDIAAVLSFSPGEYFDGVSVAASAARVHVPVFIDTAASAEERSAAAGIYAAVPSAMKQQYRARHGVHGSSTLLHDKDPKGDAENWRAVEGFLAVVAP
jgi:alpha-beta hydrolase superfamily lysophospholipase